MSNGDNRDPQARSSTDEGLRNERKKTDIELASRSNAMRDAAAAVVTEARNKADAVLSDARDREDLRLSADHSTEDRTHARASEDAILECARSGADVLVRDEGEQRRVALASLLAFEREFTDIRLESERVRADQALSSREDFMAMVSHDLRSLLGGIALSAELLKEVGKTDDPLAKVTKYAEQIQRLSARMNRLVGDLMDVATIEAGKLGLVRVRRNASLLLRDSIEAFEPAARAQDIQLRCECSIDPGVVELDHERILQVLTNLVGNALKFTPRGGRITIRLKRHGDDLCFAVGDTGTGIPAEFIEKIFDRYFQTNINDRRGLGLGLFISKSIVEGHGGTIRVESTPGRGSTFFLTVPARAIPDNARSQSIA
jgi:signal transduction histidine kinase